MTISGNGFRDGSHIYITFYTGRLHQIKGFVAYVGRMVCINVQTVMELHFFAWLVAGTVTK
jgi:hypothetical protein